ncbi:MAG: hypothetical protein ACLSGI_12465 [Butyricicoccaceae bacterium]
MSKSRGNVVNPDDIVDTYGADTASVRDVHHTLRRLLRGARSPSRAAAASSSAYGHWLTRCRTAIPTPSSTRCS